MGRLSVLKDYQRGAIAIAFAVSLVVLFALMGIAIDLGRLYVVKTELQNGADAAALAGAKELNQRLLGVTAAVTEANRMAGQNRTIFSFIANSSITIPPNNIWVGSCPADACMVLASTVTSDALAAGRTFLKVHIPSVSLTSYFMQIVPVLAGSAANTNTSTYGMAVAGRFVNNVTPIGVCALDPNTKGGIRMAGTEPELTEFGFRRGVSYNTFALGSVSGGPSDTYLLDPIGPHSSPCVPGNSSNANTAPFVCSGASSTVSPTSAMAWGNTGMQATPTERALNVRFGDAPPGQCIAALGPPDTNIRDYPCTSNSCPKKTPLNPAGLPNTWMNSTNATTPNARQTMNLAAVQAGTATAEDYGVLWSYSRAVRAVGTPPNATAGAPFTPNDWPQLYPTIDAQAAYPGGLAGTTGAPYSQTASPYFLSGGAGAVPMRRVLNLAIANCSAPIGNGSCLSIPIVGIGRFLMQVPAVLTGGPSSIHLSVEFGGLVEPIPDSEIRLYR